jgi:predicted pyridoxine 5'-phosphate oxidase superfamily flavin-nucleotide-binding protein
MAELSDKARGTIDMPNLALFTTVMKDGSPQVTPVWIARENGNLTFNTAVGRVKDRERSGSR